MKIIKQTPKTIEKQITVQETVYEETMMDVEKEGLPSLLGKNVEIWCGVYIYAGKLVGVNTSCIKLANAHVVYETGSLDAKKYTNAQKLGREFTYIQCAAIESFGETIKLG